jgi:hypothetical protein
LEAQVRIVVEVDLKEKAAFGASCGSSVPHLFHVKSDPLLYLDVLIDPFKDAQQFLVVHDAVRFPLNKLKGPFASSPVQFPDLHIYGVQLEFQAKEFNLLQ